jgi:bacterioferritin (cytochrome b1)
MSAGTDKKGSPLWQDRAVFLAHCVALEQEAADRMHELAETMAVHNNPALHELLSSLAAHSDSHALDMKALCKNETLPRFKAWEYSWPDDESPEIFHYSSVHYLMSAEDALQSALEVEQRAEAFYRDIAENATNPAIKQLAEQFATEEQEHASSIANRLSALKAGFQNDLSKDPDQTDFDPPHTPE